MSKIRRKNVYWIAVSIFSLVSVVFLWGELEDLTFSKKINDTKITGYFTVLGVFAAAITIYLLYNQLDLMREQLIESQLSRKSSKMPQLRPEQVRFRIQSVPNFIYDGDMIVTLRTNLPNDVPWYDPTAHVNVNLHNIGSGVAGSINIRWIYNLLEVQDLIRDVYLPMAEAKLEADYFDFLPANNVLQIKLPEFYVHCCGPKLNPSFGDFVKNNFTPKPELKLEIKYHDVDDQEYCSTYVVRIGCYDNTTVFDFRPSRNEVHD